MSTSTTEKRSVTESFELVTGYDEQAVEAKFGTDFDSLRAMPRLRALIFLDQRRAGMDDAAAYDAAMVLTTKEVGDHFSDDDTDDGEEAALFGGEQTETGKGDTHDA